MKEKKMRKYTFVILLVALAMLFASCGTQATETPAAVAPEATSAPAQVSTEAPAGEKVTLTIESWRNDDLTIWQDTIIPAFEAKHPNIHVIFAPQAPAEYNGVLNTKLEGGTAGDLITCLPAALPKGLSGTLDRSARAGEFRRRGQERLDHR
jgi:ABC-type glycerol-3-phosphate transport system substrate-binding protein